MSTTSRATRPATCEDSRADCGEITEPETRTSSTTDCKRLSPRTTEGPAAIAEVTATRPEAAISGRNQLTLTAGCRVTRLKSTVSPEPGSTCG